jgi:hypothetical protein
MKPTTLPVVTLPFLALAALGSGASAQDADAALLAARRRAPRSAIAPAQYAGSVAPRVLFSRMAEDNAAALLAHSDVNGDGVGEVVVGWEISQSGNDIEVVSGGSFDDMSLVWGLVSQDGLSGGYYSDIDQLASFPDITGDGVEEVLSGTSGGGRSATLYDGATGAELQSFDTYLGPDSGWVYQVLAVEDVNASGTPDFVLVTGSDANSVYMVEGSETGDHHNELWSFTAADALFAVDVIGDVDLDGVADLVVAAGDNADDLHALSGATGAVLWTKGLSGTPWELAAYPDRTGDGIDEVVLAVWSASQSVQMRNGATGEILWTSPVPNTFGMNVVPFEDITGDGLAEVAVASWADRVFVLAGSTGAVVWESVLTGGDVWAVTRVDDVTGDGVSEIAFGSFDGFAYLADGMTGATLWTHSADGRKVLAIDSAPDLDGDSAPEVLVGAQQLSSGFATLLWVVDADSTVPGAGPEVRLSGSTAIGTTAVLELSGAVPGDVAFWFVGFAPALFPDLGFGAVAIAPAKLIKPYTSLVPVSGALDRNVNIPSDAGLIGVDAFFQPFLLSPVAPFPGESANRVGFTVGP